MTFDKLVESIINEAMERVDFDNLPGTGRPIDLKAYFDTPQDVRMAYSILKNAGMNSPKAELLRETAELKRVHAALMNEKKKEEICREIEKKQIEFSLIVERQRRQ